MGLAPTTQAGAAEIRLKADVYQRLVDLLYPSENSDELERNNDPTRVNDNTRVDQNSLYLMKHWKFICLIIFLCTSCGKKCLDVNTTVMENTIRVGQRICLKEGTPKRGDIVTFVSPITGEEWIARIAAVGGDTLQIKQGSIFVNQTRIDTLPTMKRLYHIRVSDTILQEWSMQYQTMRLSDSMYAAWLNEEDYNSLRANANLSIERYILNKEKKQSELFPYFVSRGWNLHNLGPVIIPSQNVFLMGDNLDDVLDSRYFGYIELSKITAVVVDGFKEE